MNISLSEQFQRLHARLEAAGPDGNDDEQPYPHSVVAVAHARQE
jgi:hypothetical protein